MVGFKALFVDGTQFSEADGYWDEVPRTKRMTSLALADLSTGVDLILLTGFSQYVFGNEAVSVNGGTPRLEAKIIGGVPLGADHAKCVRVILDPRTAKPFNQPVVEFAPHVFRTGVV